MISATLQSALSHSLLSHSLLCALVIALAVAAPAVAQDDADADAASVLAASGSNVEIVVPPSSVSRPGDEGVRARTCHHKVRFHDDDDAAAPSSKIRGENPFTIRRVYGLPPFGGAGTIAIVGAFHWPTALNDFNTFARTWGLPHEHSTNVGAATNRVFQVVSATGTQAPTDGFWAFESAIDTQWAHAMAPDAKILLVEAASNSFVDLLAAVDFASAQPDVKVVSMSWGSPEAAPELVLEHHFSDHPGIVYVAAAGDTGGAQIYPSTSANVVAVGGTRINRNKHGRFVSETAWANSGGGSSQFVPTPAYQSSHPSVAAQVGAFRGIPDCSFEADPATGVAVYDSTPDENNLIGWFVAGGTSVGAPSVAGIINLAHSWTGRTVTGSQAELAVIYNHLGNRDRFRDILTGTAGSFSAHAGWDFITGVGSPLGVLGK